MAPFRRRGRNAAIKFDAARKSVIIRDDQRTCVSRMPISSSQYTESSQRIAQSDATQPDATQSGASFESRESLDEYADRDADNQTLLVANALISLAEQNEYKAYKTRTADDQKSFIRHCIRDIFGFNGRDGQVNAIHHLLFKQDDLILIAKTSFGKSLIFQAVSAIVPQSISIIIIPLTRVGQGQYEKLRMLKGCNPCLLTAKNANTSTYQQIKRGVFTHVLTSPELAISEPFRKLCIDPEFGDRVNMVAIDEFHLVAQWGQDWRADYARCHVLRDRLGPHVSWFACSATLDRRTLELAKASALFADTTHIMRHSIDRPELSFCVCQIPAKTISRYEGLFFLIQPGRSADGKPTPINIPKAVVFLDSRGAVHAASHALREMLKNFCNEYTADEVKRYIGIYHAHLADFDKDMIYADFQNEQSERRIIIATDALGLGVDIADISIVVQYGIPRSDGLSAIMQRWGRAARGPNQIGTVVLLAEDWSFMKSTADSQRHTARSVLNRRNRQSQLSQVSHAEDSDAINQGSQENEISDDEAIQGVADINLTAGQQKKKRITKAERFAALPKEVREFINTDNCRRKLMLKYFNEPDMDREAIARCCDNCEPSLRDICTPLPIELKPGSSRKPSASTAAGALAIRITKWAQGKARKSPQFQKLTVPLSVDNFFPLKLISQLAVAYARDAVITNRASFNQQIRDWEWVDEYGNELWQIIQDNDSAIPANTNLQASEIVDWHEIISQRIDNGERDIHTSLSRILSSPLSSAPSTPYLKAGNYSPSLQRLRMMENMLAPARSVITQVSPPRQALSSISHNIQYPENTSAPHRSQQFEQRDIENRYQVEVQSAVPDDANNFGRQRANNANGFEGQSADTPIYPCTPTKRRRFDFDINAIQGSVSRSGRVRKRARQFDDIVEDGSD